MTRRGHQHVETLRDELCCPECSYSLRGLNGEDVTCPECGHRIDISAAVAARWTRPWWQAPLYDTLALPLAWIFISVIAGTIILTVAAEYSLQIWPLALACGLTAIIVWLLIMAYVRRRFGSDEGLWLALIIQLTLPAYLIGLTGAAVYGIRLFYDLSNQAWAMAVIEAIVAAFFAGIIVAARWLERYVGRRCVQRHLRLITASGSMAVDDHRRSPRVDA